MSGPFPSRIVQQTVKTNTDALDKVVPLRRLRGGTVASRLSRARGHLRGILRESYDVRDETDAAVHPMSTR